MELITADRLREILKYNDDTGEFFWVQPSGPRVKVGSFAGYNCGGYIRIGIDRRPYLAHRLAWLYVYGEWPAGEIDHVNRVKSDNRIANLRALSHAENNQNKARQKNNTSGKKGVSWNKNRGRWHVRIMLNGESRHVGYFEKIEAADAAYKNIAKEIHDFHPKEAA